MSIQIVKDPIQATAITHAGVFHADEVLATVILNKVFGDIRLCRVNSLSDAGDAVVYDIGGGQFDHHQKGGNGARKNGIPYASAGLIWKKYGYAVICESEDTDAKTVWEKIDEELVQGIDAVDNGFQRASDNSSKCLDLSNIIRLMNPNWDDKVSSDEAFVKAVDWMESVFNLVYRNVVSGLKGVRIVEAAIEHSVNHIMVLEQFVPWQDCVFASSDKRAEALHYVVYPSVRGGYNWQCVPDTPHGFGQRKPVPSAWCGLRGKELQELTGIRTAVFCHASGFMGSAETFEDAYALAELAERQ